MNKYSLSMKREYEKIIFFSGRIDSCLQAIIKKC